MKKVIAHNSRSWKSEIRKPAWSGKFPFPGLRFLVSSHSEKGLGVLWSLLYKNVSPVHDYLGHEDIFLYSSSVYSCHLFLISSASVRSIPFLSFIVPIFAWNVPLVSLIFLKRSLVFPILLFSSISLHWSLRKAFLSLLDILCNSAFKWVYLSSLFSFAFHFSSFHGYL